MAALYFMPAQKEGKLSDRDSFRIVCQWARLKRTPLFQINHVLRSGQHIWRIPGCRRLVWLYWFFFCFLLRTIRTDLPTLSLLDLFPYSYLVGLSVECGRISWAFIGRGSIGGSHTCCKMVEDSKTMSVLLDLGKNLHTVNSHLVFLAVYWKTLLFPSPVDCT